MVCRKKLFPGELLIPVAASPVSGEKEARAMAADMASVIAWMWRACNFNGS